MLRKASTRHLLIIIAIFIALTFLRILWLNYFLPSTHQPSAKDGVVNINNLTISEEVISLDGGWIYYPGQFVNSENKGGNKE
ncbi:hypothetical protein KQI46_15505, partial [Lysinibacillus capsici]